MQSVILIAPPAAGKGTISEYLMHEFGYTHLSTGDLLRKEIKEETEIGLQIKQSMKEGKLTPDEIILPLFKKELMKIKDKLFILDGMPRKLNQAEYLTNLLEELNIDNYVVINMVAEEDILEKRIVGRRYCMNCGVSYNIYFEEFKPNKENICNQCNNSLIQREDDNLVAFKNRYEDYQREAGPLIHYYKDKGILNRIDANKAKKEIIEEVKKIVGVEND